MFNLCAFCINFQQLHQAFHSGVGLEGKIAFKAPVATRSSRRERCLWRKCWLQGIAVVIWDLIYTKKILKAGLFINSWRFRHFGKHERCHEHFGREGNGVLMPDLYEPIFTFIMDVWGACIPSFYISGWCMPCMYKSGWWFSRIAWKYNYIYIYNLNFQTVLGPKLFATYDHWPSQVMFCGFDLHKWHIYIYT